MADTVVVAHDDGFARHFGATFGRAIVTPLFEVEHCVGGVAAMGGLPVVRGGAVTARCRAVLRLCFLCF